MVHVLLSATDDWLKSLETGADICQPPSTQCLIGHSWKNLHLLTVPHRALLEKTIVRNESCSDFHQLIYLACLRGPC